MGNNLSLAAQIPEAHVRIYKNILQIQSPHTRLQMLETVLSGPEYVASVKQAGIYGPVLSYISAVRRGDPAILPGERANQGQQQIQQYKEMGFEMNMLSIPSLRSDLALQYIQCCMQDQHCGCGDPFLTKSKIGKT